MKILKTAGIFLGSIAIILIGLFAYMGGFRTIEVREGNYGPHEIIFVTHKGPYQGLKQSWEEFQVKWENAGMKECSSLAIYLDPPETPEENLRSILGCKIGGLSTEEKSKLKEHFESFEIPESEAYLSEFPFKNFFSFMLGPIKVYPKMEEAVNETSKIPSVAIEEYGITGSFDKIKFIMPIWIDRNKFQELENSFKE
jgi:hypothetical protein